MGGEVIGTTTQALVGGELVGAVLEEELGLVSLGGFCSGCVIRPTWVVAAAHCLEVDGADGRPMPDPARPGQNVVVPPASVTVSADWGISGAQSRQAVRIETFRPYDVALIEVSPAFTNAYLPQGSTRAINDDQFPYFGEEHGMALTMFGRGINRFAFVDADGTAVPAQGDGQFRVGYAQVTRVEDNLCWYDTWTGDYIAGGDSGGPSFARVLNGYALVGVHAAATVERLPGMGETPTPWSWVSKVRAAADAPLRAVRAQLDAVMGPATVAPPKTEFIGVFPPTGPSADDLAVATVSHVASVAARRGFATGFPTFHEHRQGLDHFGGTVWLPMQAVEWRNPRVADLGLADERDFGEWMRAAARFATAAAFPGAVPSFLQADYGDGMRSGIFLLRPEAAEWRDVPLFDLDLHEEDLGDVGRRFRATHDYAVRQGYVGGFPNMFHALTTYFDPQRGLVEGIVCGTMLIKPGMGQWEDVLLFRDPT